MNHECSVVQDLLPLYQEDMVSEETKSYVQEHLDTCPVCRQAWEHMNTETLPAPPEMPLKHLKKRLRRRSLAVVVITMAVVLLAGCLWFLSQPHLATYCQDYFTVTENADGSVTLTVEAPGIVAMDSCIVLPDEVGQVVYILGCEDPLEEYTPLRQDGTVWQVSVYTSPLRGLWSLLTNGGASDALALTFSALNGEPLTVCYKIPGYSSAGEFNGYALLYGEP